MDATLSTPAVPGPAPADFESLLASVVDGAYGTALRLTGNRDDAQDLVQEAALSAFRGFRPGTQFRAWFFVPVGTARSRLEGGFVLKDLFLLGAAIGIAGESVRAASRRRRPS